MLDFTLHGICEFIVASNLSRKLHHKLSTGVSRVCILVNSEVKFDIHSRLEDWLYSKSRYTVITIQLFVGDVIINISRYHVVVTDPGDWFTMLDKILMCDDD